MCINLYAITAPRENPTQRKAQKITKFQFLLAIFIPMSVAGPVKCVVRFISVRLVAAF